MLCLSNYYAFLLTTTLLVLEVRAVSYRVIGYQSPDKVSMVHNPQIDADKADPNIKADTTILQVPEQNVRNLNERLCRPGYKMDKFKRCRAVWLFGQIGIYPISDPHPVVVDDGIYAQTKTYLQFAALVLWRTVVPDFTESCGVIV